MVNSRRVLFILVFLLIIFGVAILIISGTLNAMIIPHSSYKTPMGIITIWVPLPDAPQNLTKCRVVPKANDIAYFSVNNLEQERLNVTSVDDVPLVVPKALEIYGGLPKDAVMVYAETGYLEQHKLSGIPFIPPTVIAKYPISTDVQYGRKINGIPVTGEGSFININLGNDGELLYLNKVWRTVEPDGMEKVIPVSMAIEKLSRGEVLNPQKCFCDLNVDRIYIAYWEKRAGVPQEYLDPVWVFSGTTASGEVISYKVSARESDNSPDTSPPKPRPGEDYLITDIQPESIPADLLQATGLTNSTVNSGNISK
jgi:hypothetical protein